METLFQLAAPHWFSALVFIMVGSCSILKKIRWGWYFFLASVPMIAIPVIFNARLENMFSSSRMFGFEIFDSLMAIFTMGIIQAPAGLIMILSGAAKILQKQDKDLGIVLVILGSSLLLTCAALYARFQSAMG